MSFLRDKLYRNQLLQKLTEKDKSESENENDENKEENDKTDE